MYYINTNKIMPNKFSLFYLLTSISLSHDKLNK